MACAQLSVHCESPEGCLPLAACPARALYEQQRHGLVLMEPVFQLVGEDTDNKFKKKSISESGMCWENKVLLSSGG